MSAFRIIGGLTFLLFGLSPFVPGIPPQLINIGFVLTGIIVLAGI